MFSISLLLITTSPIFGYDGCLLNIVMLFLQVIHLTSQLKPWWSWSGRLRHCRRRRIRPPTTRLPLLLSPAINHPGPPPHPKPTLLTLGQRCNHTPMKNPQSQTLPPTITLQCPHTSKPKLPHYLHQPLTTPCWSINGSETRRYTTILCGTLALCPKDFQEETLLQCGCQVHPVQGRRNNLFANIATDSSQSLTICSFMKGHTLMKDLTHVTFAARLSEDKTTSETIGKYPLLHYKYLVTALRGSTTQVIWYCTLSFCCDQHKVSLVYLEFKYIYIYMYNT